MTRSLILGSIALMTGLSMAGMAAYGQAGSQTACGIETWSTDKQMYVSVPCTGGQDSGSTAGTHQQAAAPSNCGIETWSTDKQMYVTTPCTGGTTYENPGAKASDNPNGK